jgi:hypothetical protein
VLDHRGLGMHRGRGGILSLVEQTLWSEIRRGGLRPDAITSHRHLIKTD